MSLHPSRRLPSVSRQRAIPRRGRDTINWRAERSHKQHSRALPHNSPLMWRFRLLLLLSALYTSEIIFPFALIRANDESNVFPVRDCEGVREHVFCPFLSFSLFLLSSWGRTGDAAQILWSSHKSSSPRRLGFPRAFIIARPVMASGLRRDGNRKSRVEAEITSTGGGRNGETKGTLRS